MANRYLKDKKAVCALAALILFGAGLVLFVFAATEQSIRSGGLPTAARIPLRDLITQGSGKNKHVELVDFYFGKQYVYSAELVQFRDVYLPMFPDGQSEDAGHLQVLLWIRNDRNSNEPLVLTRQDLDRFAAEFIQRPRSVTGVLRKPAGDIQALTAAAYPGTNPEALQVLWARDFPSRQYVNILWSLCALCLVAGGVFTVAYRY